MADYESDSSGAEDVATTVLLGYASKEPTSDSFSQLGGHPAWLDDKIAPAGSLAKCKTCNGMMSLLLQLHGDLPERFPGHERRLYLWACKRKACRRKEGSVRGFRATRVDRAHAAAALSSTKQASTGASPSSGNGNAIPAMNLGETLFGAKPPLPAQFNPFATPALSSAATNPFANASSLAAKPAQKPVPSEPLAETFAQKARITSPPPTAPPDKPSLGPQEPWPEQSAFPEPYPSYYVDADTEYLEPDSQDIPASARLDRNATNGEGSSNAAEEKAAFESSMDKTFQRFADRLAQNPEQVLRYEFDGQPLLYSKTDAVGKLLLPAHEHANTKVQLARRTEGGNTGSRIPKCTNCGAARVFELQLTPHLITELEADELNIEGMDWGTILLGVCGADCQESGKAGDEVGYVEEWARVQWEEMADKRR
ncbi:hypothetical protein LTR36_007513 [Oleoguttula mirabilis]|uniref:Programmed cell death protein 2 C-terminal domain-containing protein n=1 Tax=Oleoguttula mirabilis TaxID=1507867 RepID=A0AAV9JTU2_9PEZI|nr:hypothetical protein LTR36_007513 [Oleoguttula mirabilis]